MEHISREFANKPDVIPVLFKFDVNAPDQSIKEIATGLARVVATHLSKDTAPVIVPGNRTSLNSLISLITRLDKSLVPLLLIDDTDKQVDNTSIRNEVWDTIEHDLVAPLIGTGRIVVVLTGRNRWQQFEVRRSSINLDKTLLRAFDHNQIIALVSRLNERLDTAIPVESIYPFTAGSPYLAIELVRYLQSDAQADSIAPFWFTEKAHKEDLVKIFDDYQMSFSRQLTGEEANLVYTVSTLRFYRIGALRFMLKQINAPTPREESDLLRKLQEIDLKTDIVRWERGLRSYVTDNTARRVLNLLMLLREPESFIEAHERALTWYWSQAEKFKGSCESSILEIWFHAASQFQAQKLTVQQDSEKDALVILKEQIDKALSFAKKHLHLDHFMVLLLQTDPELHELLPQDVYSDLQDKLTQFISAPLSE